jgi:uncharacterized protein (DUF2252 family)
MTVASGPRVAVGQGGAARTQTPRHLTPAERAELGKQARRRLPREQHAVCEAGTTDAVELLRADDPYRVAELLPIRYGRMLTSPFTFYRGSAAVMATDLSASPHSGLEVQLCGDAHLSNFGVYHSPERRLVFDLNDFDETLPGPFEWDVKRLAASVALAGRENGHRRRERWRTLVAVVGAYRSAMRRFARQGNLEVWYAGLDVERALEDLAPRVDQRQRERTQHNLERARRNDSTRALRKLTVTEGGRTRFLSQPPLLEPLRDLLPEVDAQVVHGSLLEVLATYRESLPPDRQHLLDQFELVEVARKVVGVGSVGTRAYVLLLTGRDSADPLVLQAKEAKASVLEPHLAASRYDHAGERVVAGQRLMQASSDIFLGWQRTLEADGAVRDYYVRQLRDGKASAEVDQMDPRVLTIYGEMCAWTLARAHARSGDRVAISAYLGKRDTFDRAVADFAEAYADRAEEQHRALQAAADRSEVEVTIEA